MSSAATKVGSTPELVEMILKRMDMQTLLVGAQRVNHTWHDIIAKSKPLQRKLFFEPIAPATTEDITMNRTKNPLLETVFKDFFDESDNLKKSKDILANTIRRGNNILTNTIMRGKNQPGGNPILREGASWRRMLVQQPACPKIGMLQESPGFGGQLQVTSYIADFSKPTDGAGVRMGVLYDWAYRVFGATHAPDASFRILWRRPSEEPELGPYSAQGGGYEVVLKRDYTPEVGIAVLQKGRVPGFEPAGEPTYDFIYPREAVPEDVRKLDERMRCAEFKPYVFNLKCRFMQDWFG